MSPPPPFFTGVRRLHLSRFYIERVQKARLYTDRTFHSLVHLRRLATWGLGLEPSVEALAHELTVRRRRFYYCCCCLFFFFFLLKFFFSGMATMKENKGKDVLDETVGQEV